MTTYNKEYMSRGENESVPKNTAKRLKRVAEDASLFKTQTVVDKIVRLCEKRAEQGFTESSVKGETSKEILYHMHLPELSNDNMSVSIFFAVLSKLKDHGFKIDHNVPNRRIIISW